MTAPSVSTSMAPRLLLILAGLTLLIGCSSTPDPAASPGKELAGTDEELFFDESIEKNYDPHVIMKRAEAFFEQEGYPEAIVEYQHFLDMHRSHVLASYAQYRLAESHFSMATSVDRDPEPILKAREAFERLLDAYPGSKYEIDALVKIRECKNWLADVNLFVGRFYYRRGDYLAAAHRFQAAMNVHEDVEAQPEALYYLALTYKEMGADDWAQEQLVFLANRYPQNKHQKESRKLLAQLTGQLPSELLLPQGAPPRNGSAPDQIVAHSAPAGISLNGATPPAFRPTTRVNPVNQVGTFGQVGRSPVNGVVRPAPRRGMITRSSVAPSTSPVARPAQTSVCRLGAWC